MKNILIFLFLISALNAADIDSHHGHNLDNSSPSSSIMFLMHKAMMNSKFIESGDVDIDFLENMIPHHQGAIDSSKELLKYSKNKHIIKIAKNIIKDQEKEIAYFKKVLEQHKISNSKISEDEYLKFIEDEKLSMKNMMQAMSAVNITNDVDVDYVSGMIYHHKGAVDVSKQILKFSKDKKIRNIANNIIRAQEAEIKEFRRFLKDKN